MKHRPRGADSGSSASGLKSSPVTRLKPLDSSLPRGLTAKPEDWCKPSDSPLDWVMTLTVNQPGHLDQNIVGPLYHPTLVPKYHQISYMSRVADDRPFRTPPPLEIAPLGRYRSPVNFWTLYGVPRSRAEGIRPLNAVCHSPGALVRSGVTRMSHRLGGPGTLSYVLRALGGGGGQL